MWGRYELIERVHQGPVAETWRARDSSGGAMVSLKKLTTELAASKEVAARFSAVAEALRTPPHWDLVAVLDVGAVHGEPYFTRAWVDGVSLAQLLEAVRRRGIEAIPPPLALTLVLGVLDVLDKLHGASLVHGHLVANNVFVLGNGAVKVTDAGLTRVIETAIGGASVIATLWPAQEAAPEQLGAGTADARTDVFAAGALLFELLTASRPGDRAADGSVIIPPAAARHVPPIFVPLLGRALEEQPERRFQNVEEMIAGLKPVASMGLQLDAAAVALATTALVGDARMPLPPPVTELLARFALAADLPPNARKTTGESYLIAVPTPPPLPAGTPLPPPRTKTGELRAVAPPPPAATPRTRSGERGPASPLALTAPLPSSFEEEDDPRTLVDPDLLAAFKAQSVARPRPASVPLGSEEPGPTMIKPAVPDVPTAPINVGVPDVPTGPVNVGVPDVPTGPVNVGVPDVPTGPIPLGADEPEATRAMPAVPPPGPRPLPARSPFRFAPLTAGLLALGVASYLVVKTVTPVEEGAVDISSTPPGADVMVNGELMEKVTPTKLMLKANEPHIIELFLPGRMPWTETVTPTTAAPVLIRAELKGPPPKRGSN